jgi:hypothetical protein
MKCPSCGNEQADGWLSCQKCHIIFSRWQVGAPAPKTPPAGSPAPPSRLQQEEPQPSRPPRMYGDTAPQAPRPAGAAPAPLPAPPVAETGGWFVYLPLVLAFAFGLWWLLNPRGRAVEPGSHRDDREHFAVHAPAEWIALTRENINAMMSRYGSMLPRNLAQAMNGKGMAVSFLRPGRPGEFSPSLNVVVIPHAPPPINEASKAEAAKTFAEAFSSLLPDYRQESVRVIEVDKLRSLEIVSTESVPFQLPNEAQPTTQALRTRQVVVPAKDRAFLLTFTDSADAGDESDEAYRGMRDSFRVLKRPARFGSVLNGGLTGGLVGGLLFALGSLARALGGRRD